MNLLFLFIEDDPAWSFWCQLVFLPCTWAWVVKIWFPPSDDARALFLRGVSIDVVGLVRVVSELPLRTVAVAVLAATESLPTEVMHVRAHEDRHRPSCIMVCHWSRS